MKRVSSAMTAFVVVWSASASVGQEERASSLETPYASAPGETPEQRRERFTRASPRLAELGSQFDSRQFSLDGHVMPYRLFRPGDYQPDRRYPLVVFFHGGGARGTDNRKQIANAHFSPRVWALPEYQAKHRCFILAPQLATGVAAMTWNARATRVNDDDSPSPAGQWKLVLEAPNRGQRQFRFVVEQSDGNWSASIGGRGNTFEVAETTYSDGRLTVMFGFSGSGRNNRLELQRENGQLRGTVYRNLDGQAVARRIGALIDSVCDEFSIDRSRVYATGLSMGGAVTWNMIAKYPTKFAAAAPICGPCDPATAPRIAEHGVKVWVFHGGDDPGVQPAISRSMVTALRNAGASPRYTEYPGVGHNAWVDAYQDPELHAWLFEQRRD